MLVSGASASRSTSRSKTAWSPGFDKSTIPMRSGRPVSPAS